MQPDEITDVKNWSFNFLQVYDGREESCNTLYCYPHATKPSGEVIFDEELLNIGLGEKAVDKTALISGIVLTAKAVHEKLTALSASGDNSKVIVPINGAALAHKDVATEFVSVYKKFSTEMRKCIVFEVTNLTQNSMSYADDIALLMYAYCYTYEMRVPLSILNPKNLHNFSMFSTCNYSGICISLKNRNWPTSTLFPYLKLFATMTEQSSMKGYIHGVANKETFDYIKTLNIRFVDGEYISEFCN